MKFLSAILFLIFITTNLNAAEKGCYEKVGQGQDSISYHVWADLEETISDVDGAIILLKRVLANVDCNLAEIGVKKTSCIQIVPGKSESTVCYIEAKIGFFFVAKDYVDSANVIFNRWD